MDKFFSASSIVVKFVTARARHFKKNITMHLLRSMQQQGKSLFKKASELFASRKKYKMENRRR